MNFSKLKIIIILATVYLSACGGGISDVENNHPSQFAPKASPEITIKRDDRNQLIIDWPIQQNSEEYILYISSSEDFEPTQTSISRVAKPPYIADALNPGTNYFIKIVPSWASKVGPESNALQFKAPPAPPTNLSIESDALITWENDNNLFNVYWSRNADFDLKNPEGSATDISNKSFQPNNNNYEETDIIYFIVTSSKDSVESAISKKIQIPASDIINQTFLPPQNPKITASEAAFNVNWIENSSTNSYSVYMAKSAGVTQEKATSLDGGMTHNNVQPPFGHGISNGDRFYLVITANKLNPDESLRSTELSIKPKLSVAGVPKEITIEAAKDQLTISWQPVEGASSYNVYWSTTPDVTPESGQLVLGASDTTNTTVTHENLQNGLMHYYIVTAISSASESEESAEVGAIPYGQLAKPTQIQTQEADKEIIITWPEVPGAIKYHLYMATDSSLTIDNVETFPGWMKHTDEVISPFSHHGLSNDTTYYMRLTAIDHFGNESIQSELFQAAPHKAAIPNTPPTVNKTLSNQSATINKAFSFQLPENTFSDVNESDILTYTATINDGELPTWLQFNNNTRTFSGTPSISDIGTLIIDVTANDNNGGEISTPIEISIINSISEPSPTITVTNISILENVQTASITINLSKASPNEISFDYITSDISATASDDYAQTIGQLIIPTDDTTATIEIPIIDDTLFEGNETFSVKFDNATNATLQTSEITITIQDNETALPILSVTDFTVDESTSSAIATLTLNKSSETNISLDYESVDGSAIQSKDYTQKTGQIIFAPNETSKVIQIDIVDDNTREETETFNIKLSNINGAMLNADTLTITITDNDDSVKKISVSDLKMTENNNSADVIVKLNSASDKTITVRYETSDDTAINASDYSSLSGNITFNSGQISKTISIPINDDALYENNESFLFLLSNATNAEIGNNQATITIVDNDTMPNLSILDANVNEFDTSVQLTIDLTPASGKPVTINYSTQSGSATEGSDFVKSNNSLTFSAGETQKIITIEVIQDTFVEPDESFTIILSNAIGANIAKDQATVILLNDDKPTAPLLTSATAGNQQVTLFWDDVNEASAYNIYYATKTGIKPDNWSILQGKTLLNVDSGHIVSNLTNNTKYFFVVSATTGNIESQASNEIQSTPIAPVIAGETFQDSASDNSFTGTTMVKIPRGSFLMGDNQNIGDPDELPLHTVTISYNFALSQKEVTFNEYDEYLKTRAINPISDPSTIVKPDESNDRGFGRGENPVISVNFNDVQGYITWLNERLGLTGRADAYRLPAEAEWEYAAKANTTTAYFWGNTITHNDTNYGSEIPEDFGFADNTTNDIFQNTAPVGSFAANPWGLHDILGNVSEWTQDCAPAEGVKPSYNITPVDGSAWLDEGCSSFRVVRGGSWFFEGAQQRSANRFVRKTTDRFSTLGIRLAKTLVAP